MNCFKFNSRLKPSFVSAQEGFFMSSTVEAKGFDLFCRFGTMFATLIALLN